jgi:hypothetical protein
MKQAVLLVGNIVDGYRFYGPFPNAADALKWAEDTFAEQETWEVAKLSEPVWGDDD